MFLKRVKSALKSLAYASGVLGWWHRRRNAKALTVFMFHRVLPRDSAAYAAAEKEFTFSVEGFGRCLDFIGKHYQVVTALQVKEALSGGARLPACPALITFDDGWRDTLVHAYPALRARQLPALVFLATEIMESPRPAWWQDMLVQILEQPERTAALRRALGLAEDQAAVRSRASDHEVAGKLAALPLQQRLELLASLAPQNPAERQMLTEAELSAADRACLEFGAHGHTHAPLTRVAEPLVELRRSHALVATLQPAVATMSFPHGAYTPNLLDLSKSAGFDLVFTSDPTLLDLRKPATGRCIGRIHVPENEWTADAGHISFAKLATFLFFRPQASR